MVVVGFHRSDGQVRNTAPSKRREAVLDVLESWMPFVIVGNPLVAGRLRA